MKQSNDMLGPVCQILTFWPALVVCYVMWTRQMLWLLSLGEPERGVCVCVCVCQREEMKVVWVRDMQT